MRMGPCEGAPGCWSWLRAAQGYAGPSFHSESQAAGWNRGPHLKRKKVRCGFRAYLPWSISSTHELVEGEEDTQRA